MKPLSPSPEQQTSKESILAPIQQKRIREKVLRSLSHIVYKYQAFYGNSEKLDASQSIYITKDQYDAFENWLKHLRDGTVSPSSEIDLQVLVTDAVKANELRQILFDLRIGRSIPWQMSVPYGSRACELSLIPRWTHLPSNEELKEKLGIMLVGNEYIEGKSLDSFLLTDKALVDIGYHKDDPIKRQHLLAALSEQGVDLARKATSGGILPVADLLEHQLKQPNTAEQLTTKEILEILDQMRLRPATLQELCAYAQEYWRPLTDKTLHGEPHIRALGSTFSVGNSHRCPSLSAFFNEDEWGMQHCTTTLHSVSFDQTWHKDESFLVVDIP